MEKLLIALALVFVAVGVVLLRSRRSLRGVWVQEEDEGWLEILLDQSGPFLTGRCYVEGGHYEYVGFWTGGTLWLRRRDFGVQMLMAKGFPEATARKLEGAMLGRFRMSLETPDSLVGLFYPMYVKFDRNSGIIEKRYFLEDKPKRRTWLRRESDEAQALIERKEAERQAREEKLRQAREGQP